MSTVNQFFSKVENVFTIQILPELPNLDQTLCSKYMNKSLALWPNLSSQICNKLLPTRSSSSILATVTSSTSFELPSSHARVTSIKFTKQQLGSESVSEWQAFPMIGLGSDKNNLRLILHTRSYHVKSLPRNCPHAQVMDMSTSGDGAFAKEAWTFQLGVCW